MLCLPDVPLCITLRLLTRLGVIGLGDDGMCPNSLSLSCLSSCELNSMEYSDIRCFEFLRVDLCDAVKMRDTRLIHV